MIPIKTCSNLKNKSVFNPPNVDNKHIEVFKSMVLSDLDSMKVRKIKDPTFVKKGITSLESKKDVIIRPADKGGGLVVMSKQFYKEEMCRLLED